MNLVHIEDLTYVDRHITLQCMAYGCVLFYGVAQHIVGMCYGTV